MPPAANSSEHHSHRLFLPQYCAAVIFGTLGARGAPVACGGGAVACCLGLVSAKELAGTVEGEESTGESVDLVAVSLQGPGDATAAAAAEMLSVARRAAEEAASSAAAAGAISAQDAESKATGGMWTYCDERNARRGPFPWPQVLRWSRRGFWPPGFPLRDVGSGGIFPSALAVAAMAYLFPAVASQQAAAAASAAAQAQAQAHQQQQQQQQQMMMQHQHHHYHQQKHQQPTAMATEAPPLAVPSQPRPSPVIHHLFAKEEEMVLSSSDQPQQQQQQPSKQHPQQPGRSRMNISDALSILGRSAVGGGGGGSGGGGGRRRGGGGGQQPTANLPPPPRASVPAAAYAPAVAAYRPPAAAAATAAAAAAAGAAAAAPGCGKTANPSSSSDPRSLASSLDAAVVSLSPAVAARLRAVHGDLWLDVLPEPLPWRTPEAVLAVLKSTWRSSFENGYAPSSSSHRARAAAAVEALPKSLRAARSGSGPAVSEAACALADLVRDFPGGSAGSARAAGNGSDSSSSGEEVAAVAAALARARAAAAAAASKAASAGWI